MSLTPNQIMDVDVYKSANSLECLVLNIHIF